MFKVFAIVAKGRTLRLTLSVLIGILLTPLNNHLLVVAPVVAKAETEVIELEEIVIEERQVISDEEIETPKEDPYCFCVRAIREEGGNAPRMDAKDIQPNITFAEAQLGDIIIFEYEDSHHVALILAFEELGFYVVEGNYKHCERTYRTVDYNDSSIRGFWTAHENIKNTTE